MVNYLVHRVESGSGPLNRNTPNDGLRVFKELEDHINSLNSNHELHSVTPLFDPGVASEHFSFVVVFRMK